MINNTQIYKYY